MKRQLKELAEHIQVGYQARGAVKEDLDGTHWLVQMRDLLDDGTVTRDSLTRFSPDRKKSESYTVFEDDVLLQVRGIEHKAAIGRGLPENTLASSHFYILRVNPAQVVPEYLAWYINQPVAQNHLLKGAQGAGNVTVVTKAVFESLPVPVPPLDTQRKIIELARLQRQEKELTETLLAKRAQWLGAVSQQLAEGKSIKKGAMAI